MERGTVSRQGRAEVEKDQPICAGSGGGDGAEGTPGGQWPGRPEGGQDTGASRDSTGPREARRLPSAPASPAACRRTPPCPARHPPAVAVPPPLAGSASDAERGAGPAWASQVPGTTASAPRPARGAFPGCSPGPCLQPHGGVGVQSAAPRTPALSRQHPGHHWHPMPWQKVPPGTRPSPPGWPHPLPPRGSAASNEGRPWRGPRPPSDTRGPARGWSVPPAVTPTGGTGR